jgi:hypothetical protein
MDRIRHYAVISARRVCAAFLLFSLPFLIGLLRYPLLDLHSTALLFTLMWLWLSWRAWRAPHTNYRRQEVWELLDHWHGLPERKAHPAISGAVRRAFLAHADLAALIAFALWLAYGVARLSN